MTSFLPAGTRRSAVLGLIFLMLLQVAIPGTAICGSSTFENWLILGPMEVSTDEAPTQDVQKQFFQTNHIEPTISGITAGKMMPFGQARLQWNTISSDEDGIFDLDKALGDLDYIAAYAYSEIELEAPRIILVSCASDDAIRVWHNGTLVHEFWGGRPLTPDEDYFALNLNKGTNTVLVKIQDMEYGFGFQFDEIREENAGKKLVRAAGHGHIDRVKMLLDYGADPNATMGPGISAVNAATYQGRQEIIKLLVDRGADAALPAPPASEVADFWIKRQMKEGDPAIGAIVSKNGEILYQNVFGLADVSAGLKANTETIFRIGSVTKQFTAAAILRLEEKGKLSLDDKLSKYIPDFPKGDKISLEMLLNHTSGIHSYTAQPEFMDRVTEPIITKDLIEEIKGYEFDFEPGTSWAYNNSAYMISGWIIKQVSEKSLAEFWKKEFFEPLGMTRTGVYNNSEKRPENEANGYDLDEGVVRSVNWDMSWAGGAGNIYSTLADLVKWSEALHSGKILSETSYTKMTTPAQLGSGEDTEAFTGGYGLGIAIDKYRGVKMLNHSGGLNGFLSNLQTFPEQGITIAALMNTSSPRAFAPSQLTAVLGEFFFPEIFKPQSSFAEVELDAAKLDEYVGQYEYQGGAIMSVRRDGDRLMAKLATQDEFQIYPRGEDEFFWKVVPASIRFTRGADQKVNGGIHSQGGMEIEVPKIEPLKEVQVDPEILQRYVGSYDLRGMELTVEVRDENLTVNIGGQHEIELKAKSETEFFPTIVKALITFEINAEGEVSGLVLNQNGVDQRAARK